MPATYVNSSAAPKLKNSDTFAIQLGEIFDAYLPKQINLHISNLTRSEPQIGLRRKVSEGELSEGQWRLYVAATFLGQVENGGVEGFFDNYPGLILDVGELLGKFGNQRINETYNEAAAPFVRAMKAFAARFPEAIQVNLLELWPMIDTAWERVDESIFKVIDGDIFDLNRNSNPNNWLTHLEKTVIEYSQNHPEEFCR